MSKKGKTQEDIKREIENLQAELHIQEKKLMDEARSKDPIATRLAEHGFSKVIKDPKSKDISFGKGKHGSREKYEKFQHNIVPTEFPEPDRRFRLVLEYANFNIEQCYYWFLRYFNESWGFNKVEKVIDTMASSVSSSNFGNLQTRLGAQQAQASQYLKGVSDMIKGLFQIVREIKILDERLSYYYDSDKDLVVDEKGNPIKDKSGNKQYLGNPKAALSSEIVLKGLWIDQVEGGAKNPGSIYGLAQTIGFTILPDLFFRMQVSSLDNLEAEVDNLSFNAKVKEVLKRKLRQYYEWKRRTKKELETRKIFELRYLKQHYDVIKLYMSWVKPYLRNVRRLQLYEKNMGNPSIINSFETQITEIETLFVRSDFKDINAVVSLHIFYRIKPELNYHSYEYQHKGPSYTGMADITLRAYHWKDDAIEAYKKYRMDDDLDLMSDIDKSIADAMDALGDDLKKFLEQAENPNKPSKQFEEEPEKELPGALDPFIQVFKGFGELFSAFQGSGPSKPKKQGKKGKEKPPKRAIGHTEKHRAEHFAVESVWEAYYRYKMGPGGNIYWVE